MWEILIAFVFGLTSFLSPCILPIIPGFVASLGGSVHPGEVSKSKRSVTLSTLYFVLGFSLVFALLGTLIACVCGPQSTFGLQLKSFIAIAGAVTMIAFGIFFALSTKIPRLNFENLTIRTMGRKFSKTHASYTASWIIGATFAGAWSPCVGPLLASILALAATAPATAYNSLLAYALGLGIPFIIISIFMTELSPIIVKFVVYEKYFNYIMSGVLIIVGLSLLLGVI